MLAADRASFKIVVALAACAVLVGSNLSFAAEKDPSGESSISDAPLLQCSELVKECFTKSDLHRTNCFFSSAKHPFCEGTSLGKLTYKRWAMSPVHPSADEAPPAFLGPRLVDHECLGKFDNQLSGILIGGNPLDEAFDKLNSNLDGCTKKLSNEMMRP